DVTGDVLAPERQRRAEGLCLLGERLLVGAAAGERECERESESEPDHVEPPTGSTPAPSPLARKKLPRAGRREVGAQHGDLGREGDEPRLAPGRLDRRIELLGALGARALR